MRCTAQQGVSTLSRTSSSSLSFLTSFLCYSSRRTPRRLCVVKPSLVHTYTAKSSFLLQWFRVRFRLATLAVAAVAASSAGSAANPRRR